VNKDLQKNILLISIPVIILIFTGISLNSIGVITTSPQVKSPETVKVQLILDFGDDIVESYNVKSSNATVYSILIQASVENNFSLGSKYYKQYQSHYVHSIKSVEEMSTKFWQYYINGQYGSVGADLQTVKDGDLIEWKYQEPII
jgi:hypothetical protein